MQTQKFQKPIILASAVLCATFLLSVTAWQDIPPKAKINIDGFSYMIFLSVDDDGEIDPDGGKKIPVFVIYGQEDDKLYGSMSQAEFDEIDDTEIIVDALVNGVVKGKKLDIGIEDETGFVGARLKGRIIKGGDLIKTTVEEGGIKMSLKQERVREADNYGGLYLGEISLPGLGPPAKDNFVFGLITRGDKMFYNFAIFDAASDELITADDEGPFDPDTGEFSFVGDPNKPREGSFTGVIDKNGKMTMQLTFPSGSEVAVALNAPAGVTIDSTLYYFGDKKLKTPKLSKPKPSTIIAGETTMVTVKTRFMTPGALVSEDTAGVYIKGYRLKGKKLEVDLVVADWAVGTDILIKVTNPSGKSGVAKKIKID